MKPGASIISCGAVPAARAIPGSSRFYLSLEDDLMRIFGRIASGDSSRLGWRRGSPSRISWFPGDRECPETGRGAELEIRKHLLEYDDVMNKQRQLIYSIRRDILTGKDFKEHVQNLVG